MPVQITINGADAAESIRELSALAAGLTGQSVNAAATEEPKSEKPAKARNKQEAPKKEEIVSPAPEDNQDEADPEDNQDEADPEDEIDSDEPIPTDVELRSLAREIGQKGPEAKAAIKELLNKYGVSNITAVPENKRIAFKRELEAI